MSTLSDFNCTTEEKVSIVVDFEKQAHEAAMLHMSLTGAKHSLLPSEFTSMYLGAYETILKGIYKIDGEINKEKE